MAISDLLNRRVRALPDGDDDEVYSQASSLEESDDGRPEDPESDDSGRDSLDRSSDLSNNESENSQDEEEDDEDDEEDSEEDSEEEDDISAGEDDVQASLNNISFGALAKAQASLGPKAKHRSKALKSTEETRDAQSPLDDIRARIHEAREQKRKAALNSRDTKTPSRSSKHAPAVQSSKFAVSRKRIIVEPPSVSKYRDPRFDPTVVSRGRQQNPDAASKAYSFLDDYRAAELQEMKEKLSKTKDPRQREALQRSIRSASDRLRTIENNKREKEVLAEHKKREKQLIREGKKSNPYFLKKSELKKQVLLKKYENMSSKDRAKALERRRKKVASKEIKEMPMERRGFGGDEGLDNDASRKRRRLA